MNPRRDLVEVKYIPAVNTGHDICNRVLSMCACLLYTGSGQPPCQSDRASEVGGRGKRQRILGECHPAIQVHSLSLHYIYVRLLSLSP